MVSLDDLLSKTPEEVVNNNKSKIEQIEKRVQILNDLVQRSVDVSEVEGYSTELADLVQRKQVLTAEYERAQTLSAVSKGEAGRMLSTRNFDVNNNIRGNNTMENTDIEVRSFQKFLTSGMKNLSEEEQRSLTLASAGAVLPVTIANQLITEDIYSDLLYRATVLNESNAGIIRIPVASSNKASWKVELEEAPEASPTLTNIELSGFELMRLMTMSAATASMTSGNFKNQMLQLLSSEVIEAMEESFVLGTGVGQPKGLTSLEYTADNQVVATTAITPADIASALGKMPQKYARNSVIMCNADTLYNIVSLFKGTAEYAFSLADGASRFMNKEIIINEHVTNGELYVVNPKELYVRFAQPITVESNGYSGFRSAAIDLRALTVVDAAWNPKAVVKVAVGA